MNFLFPTFLAALAALSIPIIIHLFHFRRFKKVYFTNIQFLKEIKEERASRSKLRHLLVLLMRMLAIAALVLAFTQPYIPKNEEEIIKTGPKAVSVFIDNSFSMNSLSDDVSLFEKAKYSAREIVEVYNPNDKFQLITNDFQGKHQRLVNKEEFLSYLEEVAITPQVQRLQDVINRQKQALSYANTDQKSLFVISDFQKNMASFQNDTSLKVYLVPLQAVEQQNVFIDSVWFESPNRLLNQSNRLLVRIHNTGQSPVENSRLELRINQKGKALTNFSVKAKSTLVDTINFTITETGWHKAEMVLTDYPITFDDKYYFSFEVAEKINILAVNETKPSVYLNALLNGLDNFVLNNQSINKVDYAKLPKHQLIILNNLRKISSGLMAELQQYVLGGGSLLVFPNPQMDIASYNALLKAMKMNTYIKTYTGQREVDFVNTKQEIFKDVFEKIASNIDLPDANTSFEMTNYANTGEESLMKFRGGASFLSKYRYGDGKAYLATVPLDTKYSNLASHAIFVPMVYKIALMSNKNTPIAYTIGENSFVEIENRTDKKESVFKLKGPSEEFIPGQKILGSKLILNLNNQIQEAGIYKLYMEAIKPLDFFGFNFNRAESILDYFSLEELKEKFKAPNIKFLENVKELAKEVGQIEKGIELWKWCLLAALAFLLLEVLLLRLWKN